MSKNKLIRDIIVEKTSDVSIKVVGDGSRLVERLCVATLIYGNSKQKLHEERLVEVVTLFDKIYRIINEHSIRLPEEEFIVESVVGSLSEEGEMNVTAGIDASTPRIRKKKTDEPN